MRKLAIAFIACAGMVPASAGEKLFIARPLIAAGQFTDGIDGAACDVHGNVYAANFGGHQTIGKVTADGKGESFIQLPGRSAASGIVIDRGTMYVADFVEHKVWKIDLTTKRMELLINEPRMNQPNDLALAPNGILYASDPNWSNGTGQVWAIDPNGTTTRVAKDMGGTNGLDVSPDGKTLYVNESVARQVWAFPILPNGTLGARRLLARFVDPYGGLESMRCDVDGNLYINRYDRNGAGIVAVLSPEGTLLREIDVLGTRPRGICFGGPDGCTAYVTEALQRRVVQFRTDRPGLAWQRFRQ